MLGTGGILGTREKLAGMEGITSAGCPCATSLPSSAQRGGLNISEVFVAAHHRNPEAGIIPRGLGPSLKFPSIKNQWKITFAEGLVSPTSSPTQSRAGILCSSCQDKTAQKRSLVLAVHDDPHQPLLGVWGSLREPGASQGRSVQVPDPASGHRAQTELLHPPSTFPSHSPT